MRRASAGLSSVVAAPLLVSCVLFVSPDTFGDHCRFANASTPCGQCIVTRCQTDVDACCTDDACNGETLSNLETCAGGDVATCDRLATLKSAAAPSRVGIARCVDERCRADCSSPSSRTNTKCTLSSFGKGESCSCVVSATPNDVQCSEASVPDSICCAPPGWPAESLRCTCKAVSCSPTGDGCRCLLIDAPSEGKTCTGTKCCQNDDICTCGTAACIPPEKPVTSCGRPTIGCANGLTRVSSCVVAK